MTEPGLYELPQRYLDLQAEARALATACADVADRADEADHFDPDMRERLHRDAHGWAIAGGTPAIQRTRIAAELLGRTFSQRVPEVLQ